MNLPLSIALGDYDRTRPLIDRAVLIDGVDPVYLKLEPEEMFFRTMRHAEFDASELSFSSFAVKTARGDCDYVGVPVFLSRAFRHNAIYVRTDAGIEKPEDLKGKRVGIAEYQLTACVWARILLEQDHQVRPSDVHWVRGGVTRPGRPEKLTLDLPPEIDIRPAPEGVSIDDLLVAGEIDAFVGPRAPPCFDRGDPNIVRLFADPRQAAIEYYERTRIFPIMHVLAVRKRIIEQQPWLPATLLKAFEESKRVALEKLADASAAKVTLPFVEEQLASARALMGQDYWPYGIAPNRHVIDTFLEHHHAQGLSKRRLTAEDLFHPSTFEVASI